MDGTLASKRLRDLRESRRLSRSDIQKAANTSVTTVQKLETVPEAWNSVTSRTLNALASALGVDEDYFTRDDDTPIDPAKQPIIPARTRKNAIEQPAGDLLASIQTLLQGQGYKSVKIDVTEPLTDGYTKQRLVHLGESPAEQALCFLEGQRLAIVDWLELDASDRTSKALQDGLDSKIDVFFAMHNIEKVGKSVEIQEIGPKDQLYAWKKEKWTGDLKLKESGTADTFGFKPGEIFTITKIGEVTNDDGEKLVEFTDSDDDVHLAVWKLGTDSNNPKDYQLKLEGNAKQPEKRK